MKKFVVVFVAVVGLAVFSACGNEATEQQTQDQQTEQQTEQQAPATQEVPAAADTTAVDTTK